MKFNDGYWLLRQGVTAAYAKQAFAVETSVSDVSIAVLTGPWNIVARTSTPPRSRSTSPLPQPMWCRSAPRGGRARRHPRPRSSWTPRAPRSQWSPMATTCL